VRQRSSTGTVGVANMSKIISHGTLTDLVCFWVSLNTQRLGIFEPGPEVPVVGPGWALWDAGALRIPRGSKHIQNHIPVNAKGFSVFMSVSDHPQAWYFWTEEPKPGPQIQDLVPVGPGSALWDTGLLRRRRCPKIIPQITLTNLFTFLGLSEPPWWILVLSVRFCCKIQTRTNRDQKPGPQVPVQVSVQK